jgi:hypothetical protein
VENVGNALHVVDLDSANGTEINGRLVFEGSLSPGDRLQLGPIILECRARPTRTSELEPSSSFPPNHVQFLYLECPECHRGLYTTWEWVERASGGYDFVCVCEHCGHRWLREETSP